MHWRPRTLPAPVEPFDLHLFSKGEHPALHRVLGATPCQGEAQGFRFAVWAPGAKAVSLVGDFNDWLPGEHPLFAVGETGIWTGLVPGFAPGSLYKFAVRQSSGSVVFKADPLALQCEPGPGGASVAWASSDFSWTDGAWMSARARELHPSARPVSIYQVHLQSWRRTQERASYDLSRLAEELIPYAKSLGFSHLGLLPIAHHLPEDGLGLEAPWLFALSPCLGDPDDLRRFVDRCHQAGLGVILDWSPGRFHGQEGGLARLDGTPLYEHPGSEDFPEGPWASRPFDLDKPEVRSLILSSAFYWLRECHADGLRVVGVERMLYLDRLGGEWTPNIHGGIEYLPAMNFFRTLSDMRRQLAPGALLIADSTAGWPGLTRPTHLGGLGLDLAWDRDWSRGMLSFLAKEPAHRSFHHNSLICVAGNREREKSVLPLSHLEASQGQGSLLSRMPGDTWQRLANLRLLLTFTWSYPGKKLLFMGGELAQWSEWGPEGTLDWALKGYPSHDSISRLVADLNWLLASEPAQHRLDGAASGFEWIDYTDYASSVLSFARKDGAGSSVIWVFNFSPVIRRNYHVGCTAMGFWREVFNSDSSIYGGENVGNIGGLSAVDSPCGPYPHHLPLVLPPLGALALKHKPAP